MMSKPDTAHLDHTRSDNNALFFSFMIGAFALGTSENVIAGILPQLASGLSVTEGKVGLLVTAYAATVFIAGPILAIILDRYQARRIALYSLIIYLLGSLLAVVSPNFTMMMVARVLTGLVHTTLLVAFATTALSISSPDRQASATAKVTLGLSVATVLGVPIGVGISHYVSWRASFVLIAVLTAISLVLCLKLFPQFPATRANTTVVSRIKSLQRPQVLLGAITTTLIAMAALTVVVYVVPFLTNSAGISAKNITWIMFLYGLGCVAGNYFGGQLANSNILRALVVSVSATTALLVVLSLVSTSAVLSVITLVLLGFAYFATFPSLNTWMAQANWDASPSLALAFNSSAFNGGIALAGWLGGIYVSSHRSIQYLPIIGLIPAILATVSAVAMAIIYRNSRDSV